MHHNDNWPVPCPSPYRALNKVPIPFFLIQKLKTKKRRFVWLNVSLWKENTVLQVFLHWLDWLRCFGVEPMIWLFVGWLLARCWSHQNTWVNEVIGIVLWIWYAVSTVNSLKEIQQVAISKQPNAWCSLSILNKCVNSLPLALARRKPPCSLQAAAWMFVLFELDIFTCWFGYAVFHTVNVHPTLGIIWIASVMDRS